MAPRTVTTGRHPKSKPVSFAVPGPSLRNMSGLLRATRLQNLKLLAPKLPSYRGQKDPGLNAVGRLLRETPLGLRGVYRGTIAMSTRRAEHLCEVLHLPAGWFDEPRSYSDLPPETLNLLPGITVYRERDIRPIRRTNLKLVLDRCPRAVLVRLVGLRPHKTIEHLLEVEWASSAEVARQYCAALELPDGWFDEAHAPQDVPARVRELLPNTTQGEPRNVKKRERPVKFKLDEAALEVARTSDNLRLLVKGAGSIQKISRLSVISVGILKAVLRKERKLSLHERFQLAAAFSLPQHWLVSANVTKTLPRDSPPIAIAGKPVEPIFSSTMMSGTAQARVLKHRARRFRELVASDLLPRLALLFEVTEAVINTALVHGEGLNDTTCEFVCHRLGLVKDWLDFVTPPETAPVAKQRVLRTKPPKPPKPPKAPKPPKPPKVFRTPKVHKKVHKPQRAKDDATAMDIVMGPARRQKFIQLTDNPNVAQWLITDVGLTPQDVDAVRSGELLLGMEVAYLICQSLNLNPHWFDLP